MADEIHIIIADDHPVVRRGLRMAIEEDSGLKLVAEAGDGEAALAVIEKLRPQVAVLDIDMPKLDGFGVAREIGKRRLPVETIFLTMHTGEDLFLAALELGAKGYILKDSAMVEIVAGVRAVAAGRPYLSSALTARLLQRREKPGEQPREAPGEDRQAEWVGRLSPNELRIVQLIAFDKSSKEIGEELSIHYRTVENHRTNICRKLGIEGANALLRFALQNKHKL
jgi:DNA-binding NarL/FixJ family response regulator